MIARPFDNCGRRALADRVRSGRGGALVVMMAIVTAVLLLGAALFALGVGEGDLVEGTVDDARAFYLAEAGLARGRSLLDELGCQDPAVYPGDFALGASELGEGTYVIDVDQRTTFSPWINEYAVVATGTVDGVSASVRGVLRGETFAQYLFFAHHSDDVWFATGDSLHGRVHVNGHLKVSGTPWFGMKVTSSANNMVIFQDSEPVFMGGYELGVPEIPLPSTNELTADLIAKASSGGLNCATLNGPSARYEVELARSSQYGYLSYRAYRRVGNSYSWTSWSSVRLSNTNGVAWFGSPISSLKGILDGRLTLGCAGNITITDDIRYRNSAVGYGPNPGCDDLLGICSAQNVIIADNAANRTNCEIHAHIMALQSSLSVQNYNQGNPRGDLRIFGGVAQANTAPVGTFQHNGDVTHGYQKDYHFDWRLAGDSPPGYPLTGGYVLASWKRLPAQQG